MAPVRIPTAENKELALSRLQRHAKKNHLGKKGFKEIRTHFKGNHLFLEGVTEVKAGITGRIFRMGTVRGVAKLARMEFLGPDKWKLLIYKSEIQKYGPHKTRSEGTVEECLDAVAQSFFGS